MAKRILNSKKIFKQFDVLLVCLDPMVGSEIQKTRPCIVISPDEMNGNLRTIIIVPMTSQGFDAPFRINVVFDKINGLILLDHIRSIDKKRIVKNIGRLKNTEIKNIKEKLIEMFS